MTARRNADDSTDETAGSPPDPREVAAAGLCATCRHVRRVTSGRGSTFFRCGRADEEPAFPRYPRLPVLHCPGHEQR